MICVNDENTENEECVVLTHNFDYHGEDDMTMMTMIMMMMVMTMILKGWMALLLMNIFSRIEVLVNQGDT